MKAVVYTTYGPPDVLRLKEVNTPTPGDSEILIKVHASSVNAYDWHALKADPFLIRMAGFGLFKPKNPILGADVAGQVTAAGRKVTQFQPGNAVYGDLTGCGCGGFAEYVCAPERMVALKPADVTFEEAAAVPLAGITALQGLRDHGGIASGQKVLINGASGGVGMFAVPIAKSFNAEVTAVCSTQNMETALSSGADHVIDYTQEDFTRSGKQYNLILGANGFYPISHYKRALTPNGTYIMAGGSGMQIFQGMIVGPLISMFSSKRMGNFVAKPNQADLEFMKDLLNSGKVVPVIDRRYPLDEVAEAIRYVDRGHARGKVVITVIPEPNRQEVK